MRDPQQSFSSRAAKTKKGSPAPPTRVEAVPSVASYVIYIHTWSDIYIYIYNPPRSLCHVIVHHGGSFVAFACIQCRDMSDVCVYHIPPSVCAAVDGLHTYIDMSPEVLKDLEKLSPVPGCTMGHYDKANASSSMSISTSSTQHAHITHHMYTVHTHISRGTDLQDTRDYRPRPNGT